ncbi:hypothetical protein BHE16_00350 [Neomicrococcus aestuarii]|uniref:Uncharacterized protein n=1 Tax=Neomicrococcus aestuarii TaxID=556325 RepID=A0A1L2ZK05_9MICC|nr:hypothetical protein BHE16_00350 [Neomicrococcus aestuarii]
MEAMWEEVEGKWRTLGSVSAKRARCDAMWPKIGRSLDFVEESGGLWDAAGSRRCNIRFDPRHTPTHALHARPFLCNPPLMRGHFSTNARFCEASLKRGTR